MLVRTLMICTTLLAAGCAVSPESPEEVAAVEAPMRIRTTVPNGCFISICKKDGSGQYASVLYGTYVCDAYKNCYCIRDGESAPCGLNSTDCRQSCTKTTPGKMETIPVLPMPTAALAN